MRAQMPLSLTFLLVIIVCWEQLMEKTNDLIFRIISSKHSSRTFSIICVFFGYSLPDVNPDSPLLTFTIVTSTGSLLGYGCH